MNTFLHTEELPNKALQCQADLDELIVDKEYAFLRKPIKRVLSEGKGIIGQVDYEPEDYVLMSGFYFLTQYFKQVKKPIMLSNVKEYDNIIEMKAKNRRKKPHLAIDYNIYMIAEEFENQPLPENSIEHIMTI